MQEVAASTGRQWLILVMVSWKSGCDLGGQSRHREVTTTSPKKMLNSQRQVSRLGLCGCNSWPWLTNVDHLACNGGVYEWPKVNRVLTVACPSTRQHMYLVETLSETMLCTAQARQSHASIGPEQKNTPYFGRPMSVAVTASFLFLLRGCSVCLCFTHFSSQLLSPQRQLQQKRRATTHPKRTTATQNNSRSRDPRHRYCSY